MTNVAEKEKNHKTSSQPLTDYRLTLLENNYDRLNDKLDKILVAVRGMLWKIPAIFAAISLLLHSFISVLEFPIKIFEILQYLKYDQLGGANCYNYFIIL
ncbi:hypothetical protein CKC_00175 [Candidatus Liberibacter solanacearum CLso-ZC1]|uniref:Uncharacterized protein n=1 Tax=Liberibacter solanacearum (strain CLso-ZC1) TaxID=658172 RepID=E4UBP6_LIBSC|nr:hypothetical protein [Candidatus Liberibacter solanacearum]ADR51786.1 hypothetical protein CKC_00175 [Candidatus Liberibacter solanacearum CLso-ZC1]